MSLAPSVLADGLETAAVPAGLPRLIGVFGTPSAMTHWGIHLARIIIGSLDGDHGVVNGNRLTEFAGLATGSHPACVFSTVLCTSDCPEVALFRFLHDAAAPLVVFAEEPDDVIDDLVAVSGADAVNALRLATRSLCALQQPMEAPRATVFGRRHLSGAMHGFVDELAAAMGLTPTPDQRVEIDRHLAAAAPLGAVRDHLGRLFPVFAARRRELAGEAVAEPTPPAEAVDVPAGAPALTGSAAAKLVARPYETLAAGRPFDEAEWPASIFSSGDAIGDFLAGPCEMTGPARIMIYGPYMHLPSGAWTAGVEMEVAENESGNRLKVDLVCGPTMLVTASADMPVLGRYTFALDFAIIEPLEPVELRFQIESGAIEGRFLLRRVVMRRRPAA